MNESNILKNVKERLENTASESKPKLLKEDIELLLGVANKYRTLHDIGKLIASEMELDALLRLAMDKVIEVTRATRGFIALVDDNKRFDFKVARNMQKSDIEKPRFEVSRSIIQKVQSDGETICLPDAMADATFGGMESVTRLQLLSVLCTPIKIDDKVVGLIYVDNTNVKDLFDDAMADLLTAFSEQVAIALKNVYLFSDLKRSHRQLADELRAQYQFDAIIGSGARMTEILQLVADVADTDARVLIQGENGAGKELIARALHYNSSRREQPFITVNCGAIPQELIESELFGHEKGAFTGAIKRKHGKFELAEGGTIFLDEIAEMRPTLHVKLLRVLENGSFSPVGSEDEKHADVRVVAATNRDLKKMLADNTFREDLYYRLNVINITVPPLRERREDILLLIDHFIQKHKIQDKTPQLSKPVEQILLDYDYPGNVRQLENIIQRAAILCKGNTVEVKHLPDDIHTASTYNAESKDQPVTFQERKQRVIEKFEKNELTRILTKTAGKVRESARVAGMDVKNFSEKLSKYGIKAGAFRR
ncbi:MAG: sigma 54-interacting transcriptional regulator [bacterium]